MSDSDIQEILHRLQVGISVPKNRYNSFGRYHYRSAEDIVDAIKKLLPSKTTLTLSDKVVKFGERYYVKATARLTLGKEHIIAEGWAREPDEKKGMDSSQITGTASSYARKYALNGLFAIDDGVDSDSQNNKGTAQSSFDLEAEYALCVKQIEAVQFKADFIAMWNSQDSKNRRARIKAANEAYYSELGAKMKDRMERFAEEEKDLIKVFTE